MVPASLQGRYVIRYTVTSPSTTADDIRRDYNIIRAFAKVIYAEFQKTKTAEKTVEEDPEVNGITDDEKKAFGVSLLLANSPLSPKFVNGSYGK